MYIGQPKTDCVMLKRAKLQVTQGYKVAKIIGNI